MPTRTVTATPAASPVRPTRRRERPACTEPPALRHAHAAHAARCRRPPARPASPRRRPARRPPPRPRPDRGTGAAGMPDDVRERLLHHPVRDLADLVRHCSEIAEVSSTTADPRGARPPRGPGQSTRRCRAWSSRSSETSQRVSRSTARLASSTPASARAARRCPPRRARPVRRPPAPRWRTSRAHHVMQVAGQPQALLLDRRAPLGRHAELRHRAQHPGGRGQQQERTVGRRQVGLPTAAAALATAPSAPRTSAVGRRRSSPSRFSTVRPPRPGRQRP
jgi:hypothetical protein